MALRVFQGVWTRTIYSVGRIFREAGLYLDKAGSVRTKDIAYLEPLSRHRNIMPLYDSIPAIVSTSVVAPNASVIGEVFIGGNSTISYGAILRADQNPIRIGYNTTIGENAILYTTAQLPTGVPSSVNVGNNVTIEHGVTLYSCTIDDDVIVGFKSIILEGAKLERGCVIGPNTLVPPGRLIPAGQYWEGSPAQYVRDVKEEELAGLRESATSPLALPQ
eukprot:TRINITY_DN5513_c0_g1_i2.p1 TRINITY_DN5513_c0_g1~~TRINITY_DN5513_c0_g1_i2.p1  ORF type:complete len:219 (-),score=59.38 TRINITY_DN5513_c0_g1_i2:186-842(-)